MPYVYPNKLLVAWSGLKFHKFAVFHSNVLLSSTLQILSLILRKSDSRHMPPPGASIVPALPLNHIPPSPRSEASGTTESKDSDRGSDEVISRMTQISL